jgi:molecular chaperone GrpE (heat shock protein)
LAALRKKTLDIDEQDSLLFLYRQGKNQYNELKSSLLKKNLSFKKDINNYNKQTEYKYRAFKNQFLTDILELNNNMEDIIEEIEANQIVP